MQEKDIKAQIIDSVDKMAKTIRKGKDIEITTASAGIVIKEVDKKKLA